MEIVNEQIDNVVVLKLRGRFDAYAAPAFEKFFQLADSVSNPRIVINLFEVNFVDSTGLATLIKGMKRCRQQNGDMVLCNIPQAVRIIFELTRMDKVFAISSSEEEAVRQVKLQREGKAV